MKILSVVAAARHIAGGRHFQMEKAEARGGVITRRKRGIVKRRSIIFARILQ